MKLLLENWREYLSDLEVECEQDGVCITAAEEIAKKLISDGIEDFKVIEGYIWTKGSDDQYPTEHTWIVMGDGKVIDPSVAQFDKYGGIEERIYDTAYDADGEFYGNSKVFAPAEYLETEK